MGVPGTRRGGAKVGALRAYTGLSMAPAPDPTTLDQALRRLHRSAIVSLALCATGIGIAAFAGPEADAEGSGRTYSWVALALS